MKFIIYYMVRRASSYYLNDKFSHEDHEPQAFIKNIEIPETFCPSHDQRIDLVPIPGGLKDLLFHAGITIEYLLNNDALKISQILRIDECVVSLIQNETRKLIK